MKNSPRFQSGSVALLIVLAASVLTLLFVVASITLNARELNNSLPERQQEYLANVTKGLEAWYKKNSMYIDAAPNTPAYTEEQLFEASGMSKSFDARISISNLLNSPGSNVYYRNIAVWIPGFGVDDDSSLDLASGQFIRKFQETQVAIVNGKKIETAYVIDTENKMREIARMFEGRSRALFQMDPVHDARTNYLRALSCSAVGPEEVPCTTNLGTSSSWAPLSNTDLKLQKLMTLSESMTTDAWGQTIQFNNYGQSTYDTGIPDCNIETVNTSDTEAGDPPYIASLRSKTPWGTMLCMRVIQAIN